MRPLLLAAVVALVACGDGATDPGPDPFDFSALEDALHAAREPFVPARPANRFLGDALEALEEFGVVFEPATGAIGPLASPGGWPGGDRGSLAYTSTAAPQPRVTFPPEVQGKTFVYDDGTEEWGIDPDADDAPAGGIRITWYATDGAGFPITAQVRGFIDLTDQDGAGLSRLGVVIVGVDGAALDTLSIYTAGYAISEATGTRTEQYAVAGEATNGSRTIEFSLAGVGSGTADGAGESTGTLAFATDAVGYTFDLDESVTAGGAATREYAIRAVHAGTTTEILMEESGSGNALAGTGTIRHAGAVVATFTSQGAQRAYAPPPGGSFSSVERAKLESLFIVMFSAGPYVVLEFPLLY